MWELTAYWMTPGATETFSLTWADYASVFDCFDKIKELDALWRDQSETNTAIVGFECKASLAEQNETGS